MFDYLKKDIKILYKDFFLRQRISVLLVLLAYIFFMLFNFDFSDIFGIYRSLIIHTSIIIVYIVYSSSVLGYALFNYEKRSFKRFFLLPRDLADLVWSKITVLFAHLALVTQGLLFAFFFYFRDLELFNFQFMMSISFILFLFTFFAVASNLFASMINFNYKVKSLINNFILIWFVLLVFLGLSLMKVIDYFLMEYFRFAEYYSRSYPYQEFVIIIAGCYLFFLTVLFFYGKIAYQKILNYNFLK